MTLPSRQRLVLVIVAGLFLVVAAIIVFVQLLDPGDKRDTANRIPPTATFALSSPDANPSAPSTTTALPFPTPTPPTVRVFEVSPQESQVDFVTEIGGITGMFPVQGGEITLEPVGDALRVHVYLEIDVDSVNTGTEAIDDLLRSRAVMATGDYPIAYYVAESRALVPVIEEEIEFTLDGDLQVHGVVHEMSMEVEAQLVGGDMWAVAISDLDMSDHGIELPFGSSVIQLTARLQSYERKSSPSTTQ